MEFQQSTTHAHTGYQNKCGSICQLDVKWRQSHRKGRRGTAVSSSQNIYESGIQQINQPEQFETIHTETTVNSTASSNHRSVGQLDQGGIKLYTTFPCGHTSTNCLQPPVSGAQQLTSAVCLRSAVYHKNQDGSKDKQIKKSFLMLILDVLVPHFVKLVVKKFRLK